MKKYCIITLFVLMASLPLYAQELTVKQMTLASNDISASQYRKNDFNSQPCALVKVQLATRGATFAGSVVGTPEFKNGVYWVYMPAGAKELEVQHNSFIPCHVNFVDYGITKLQALTTYVLTLLMPQTGPVNIDDGMRYLVMTVEPAAATVYIDDELQPVENGTVTRLLSMGNHRYRVEAPAYEAKSGTFTIGNEKLSLPIKLESTMATLNINCATPGTQIFVNDQLRGTTSWSGTFPAGTYRIEGRLEGYRNHRQNITLAQRDHQQIDIPALQAIVGNLNVNYQPANAEVWLDGKKVGTSPDVFRNIAVGSHDVELRASGYTSKQERITIEEGKTALLSGTLERQATAQSQTQSPVQTVAFSASGGQVESFTVNGVSFNMIRVEGGTFTMGATSEQGSEADSDEKPVHSVTLDSYYMGETEVTQALWQAVMGSNPSKFTGDSSYPVEQVSWEDCQTFISKLNRLTGQQFKLPTEAQWEYAARGGNKSRGYKYSGSDDLGSVAWYNNNSGSSTHPVKTKSPNELGLYDMSGNVLEWCQDWYGKYKKGAVSNPTGASSGSYRVLRGGCWFSYAGICRVSNRNYFIPSDRSNILGLRLVLQ